MIATVATSKNIASTLKYNENERKGGEIVFSHGIDPSMPVDLQAQVLEAMHNQRFKIKAHTIVISHGREDSKRITPVEERKYLMDFLNELERRGSNLNSAAWVIARHGNTDNVHYHMVIMNTRFDGGRFNDKFLGKNATRAAAAVSMRYGLERAPKAAEAELLSESIRPIEQVKEEEPLNQSAKIITKNVYNRRAAIAAAKKRNREYEAIHEQAYKEQKGKERLQNSNISHFGGKESNTRKGFRR